MQSFRFRCSIPSNCTYRVVKMSNSVCEVCLLDSSNDSVMWACVGCPRKFHPACVGIAVQRGSLRNLKKDGKKAIDPLSYMLPCCGACQTLVTANFEYNALVQQQAQLSDQITKSTEVIHRFANGNNLDVIREAIDRLGSEVEGMKKQLTSPKSNGINESSDIKNHITSLCDFALTTSKENVNAAMKPLKTDLLNICNGISQLNQRSLDTTAMCTMTTNHMIGVEIFDELKTMSANINALQCAKPLPSIPDEFPSLEVEFNNNNDMRTEKSGWRDLGTKTLWKADWTEYDARQVRRLQQQKMAEAARRRRNQRTHNNFGTNHFNVNRHNHSTTSHKNYYNTNSNNYNQLPPDRELLAAAKDRFSRPPTDDRHINFQRGEILNPYPACNAPSVPALPSWMAPGSSSTAPCEACRHTCFPRN